MIDLAELKQQDEDLALTLAQNRTDILRDPGAFREKVLRLLSRMAHFAASATQVQDYTWVQSAATRWTMIASSVLNDPIVFALPVPSPGNLKVSRSRNILSRLRLQQWYTHKAWELFRYRAISRYFSKSEEDILAETASSREEYEEDGYMAKIYLACEVLDGKLDFVRDFNAECYPLLEGDCWLKEVKRIKAYFRWRMRAQYWGGDAAVDDYVASCAEIRYRVLNPDVKAHANTFEPVETYLQTRYLMRSKEGSWQIDPAKCHELIAIKARRIWELTGRTTTLENWAEAENYVHEFYTNIVPAITAEDTAALTKVIEALQLGATVARTDVANCFEAAIAIHFLSASKVSPILGNSIAAAAA